MKSERLRLKKIKRTTLAHQIPNEQDFKKMEIHYFYKIKGSNKLEEWHDEHKQPKQNRMNKTLDHRSRISPRLNMLAQRKRTFSIKVKLRDQDTMNDINKNKISLKKQTDIDRQSNIQILNINKTIYSTKLGVLSKYQIGESNNKDQILLQNASKIQNVKVQRLDSDTTDGLNKTQSIHKKKISLKSKDSEIHCQNELQSKILKKIFGDEQFLQKNKLFQMMLMERNKQIETRKQTIDHKNDWKI